MRGEKEMDKKYFDAINGHSFTVRLGKRTYMVRAEARTYANKRMAIQYLTLDGEPFGTLTVNVPEAFIKNDEIIVRTTEENEQLAEAALKSGLFEDIGRRIPSGFIKLSVWRIKING
jgi:hypothetical protein